MKVLELKVPPPVVVLLVGVAMWLGSDFGSYIQVALALRVSVFFVVALAGGMVVLAGGLEFERAQTTIDPFKPQNASVLVTSGIYRYTRNPMYVGLTLVVVGWAAFLCSALALLGPVAFVLYITRFQIKPEELVLSSKFGAAYESYTARVRRWL